MIRHLVTAGIVVFWLTMMGLLVKQEVLPAWVAARRPTYRTAAGDEGLPGRSQMAILWGRRRVGTYRNVTDRDTDGSLLIAGRADIRLELPLLANRSDLQILSTVRIGADGHLRHLRVEARSPGFRQTIEGHVTGDELVVVIGEGPAAETKVVPFKRRNTTGHQMAPFEGLGHLEIGNAWYVTQVNPLTGEDATMLVQVLKRERILWRGGEVDTFVLVTTTPKGGELRSWVRPSGEVLRQQLPFAMSLEREPYTEPPAPRTRPGADAGGAP